MQEHNESKRLRRITLSEVVGGDALPGHLRDSTGRILVRAGQIVTPEHFQTLSERTKGGIFAGPDWPQQPLPPAEDETYPEELLDALRQRHSKKGPKRIRQHERHAWCVPLTLELSESGADGAQWHQMEVTTHDIAAAGFAFVSHRFIHPGTVLRARFDTLPNKPHLTAVVRNCVHLEGSQHRVGVQFAKSTGR